jgi:3-phosphoshikimate 1-carboxyvinyltransferase
VRVTGGRPLRGSVRLPGDGLVAQRALALCTLGNGDSRISGFAVDPSRSHMRSTLGVLRALGAELELSGAVMTVRGRGLGGLRAPSGVLDAGDSPAAYAIALGLLSGQAFGTRVLLDVACGQASRAQIIEALRARGAMVAEGAWHAPAAHASSEAAPVTGPVARTSTNMAPLLTGESLAPIEWILRGPDPDAKLAILLSGLFAPGPTAVAEPLLSADHTERLMTAMGVPIRRFGSMAGFDPSDWNGELNALGDFALPGDMTLASVLATLATALPGSEIVLQDVSFNPTRTGVFDALRLCGARLSAMARGDVAGNEPIARVEISHGGLRGAPLGGELAVRAGEAQSALGIVALCAAHGPSGRDATLHDPALFNALPPDAFARMAQLLGVFGVSAQLDPGREALCFPARRAASLTTPTTRLNVGGAPELGLFALMLALLAPGTSLLEGMPDLDERWPGLLGVLLQLGADLSVVEAGSELRAQDETAK